MRRLLPLLVLPALLLPPAGASGAPSASPSAAVKKTEAQLVRCANRERRKRGLPELRVAKPLRKAARMHARNMLRQGFFDHQDPEGRGPQERVDLFDPGRWYVGENIAAGYPTASRTCRGWMDSPGHRQNILRRSYTHVGGGYARGDRGYGRYYVQVFATRR